MSENKKPRNSRVQPHTCTMCGSHKGVIRKYALNLCRRCFKDNAARIGFSKYD